ncbi:sigma factor [Streptosporangium lutulentum]
MSDPSPTDPVAAAFEAQRDRLRAVAYRMLGSHADAEDAVQEAWLRLSRQDTETIHNLAELADHRGRQDQPRRPAIAPGPS